MIVLAALTAMAIGFLGTAQAMAAPAQGSVIGAAAASTSPVTKVPCAMRRVLRPARMRHAPRVLVKAKQDRHTSRCAW
jgi:hypothetical protein